MGDPRAGLLVLGTVIALYARCRGAWRRAAVIACVFFVLGTARAMSWSAKWAAVDVEGAGGPGEALILPVGPVRYQEIGGAATFRARLYDPDRLRGFLAEVTVHAQDAAMVREGVPLAGFGRLALPEQAMNPGDFDLRRYLASRRVFAALECSSIGPAGSSGVPFSWRWAPSALGTLRSHLADAIDRSMPSAEASVLKGILLADRGTVPDDLSTDFRRSGFYRFITIAGFHVDAVFALVDAGVRRLFRKPTLARLSATCLACLYAALSGWTPGALRALICSSMRAFAPEFRRRYYSLAGLSAFALISAAAVPFPLTDAGFLLSVAGALGGFAAQRYLARGRGLASGVFSGVLLGACRAGVLVAFLFPLTAALFSEFTVAGFLISGLWMAAATALIPMSALVALAPVLGRVCGWLPYLVIKGLTLVASAVSSLPVSVYVPAPGNVEMLAYYALILLLATSAEWRLRHRSTRESAGASGQLRALAALTCCAVLIAAAWLRLHPPWPRVTFLAVGQADCAVVRYGGTTILIDAATPAGFARSVGRYLRRQGVTRVDLCILSHLHQDHAGGLPALFTEVPVGAVLAPPGSSSEIATLLPGIEPAILEAVSGTIYSVGRLSISVACLPEGYHAGGDENRRSLVVALGMGEGQGVSVEFWGDAPEEQVSAYLETYPSMFGGEGSPVIAKVPHHGSKDALAGGFYDRMSGSMAVISVGTNSYGHPSNEVLEAASHSGVRLLRTDSCGAITVTLTPFGVSVRTYR